MTRRLIVLRHAEAEPYCADDFGRKLVPLGHKQAAESGDWLRRQDYKIDVVFCSGAARTRDTFQYAFPAGVEDATVIFDDTIYNVGHARGEMQELYAAFRQIPEAAQTVLMIGHNPTAPQVVLDIDIGAQLTGFGKAACAVLDINGGWADLPNCGGRLTALFTPPQV